LKQKNGTMFTMLAKNVFCLRENQTNMPDFEEKGMKPFHSEGKKKGMPYWEVPADIIDNNDQLVAWANRAYQAAVDNKK